MHTWQHIMNETPVLHLPSSPFANTMRCVKRQDGEFTPSKLQKTHLNVEKHIKLNDQSTVGDGVLRGK